MADGIEIKHHGNSDDQNPGDFSDYEPQPILLPEFVNPSPFETERKTRAPPRTIPALTTTPTPSIC